MCGAFPKKPHGRFTLENSENSQVSDQKNGREPWASVRDHRQTKPNEVIRQYNSEPCQRSMSAIAIYQQSAREVQSITQWAIKGRSRGRSPAPREKAGSFLVVHFDPASAGNHHKIQQAIGVPVASDNTHVLYQAGQKNRSLLL